MPRSALLLLCSCLNAAKKVNSVREVAELLDREGVVAARMENAVDDPAPLAAALTKLVEKPVALMDGQVVRVLQAPLLARRAPQCRSSFNRWFHRCDTVIACLACAVNASRAERHEMNIVNRYHAHLRWLYRGGRPHLLAGLLNDISARLFAAGVWPRRLAALDVLGRKSGRKFSLPVVIAEHDGERYLVSMLGENANWVKNVRADQGRAVLRHGRRESVRLVDVAVGERAPIVRAYLAVAPGARPHIPVDQHAPLHEIEKVAQHLPVFRIVTPGWGA